LLIYIDELKLAHQDIQITGDKNLSISTDTYTENKSLETTETKTSNKDISQKPLVPLTEISEQKEVSIALVDDNITEGSMTCKLLSDFNFLIHFYSSLELAQDGIANTQIDLVLLDLTIRGKTMQEVFDFGKELESKNIKTFIFTSQDTLTMKLAAVRSNISAFIVKPITITNLVSDIRSALLLDMVQKFIVYMVDDNATVIGFYKAALEKCGMQVYGLTQPEKLLTDL
jgi:CheY-like chemotaxis protein